MNHLNEIDSLIVSKHLLKHPFYLAWSKGELSMDCLKEYAKEYYHHVKAFPSYLSALHSHVENPEKRKVILQNLIEEEAGTPNHPDLWREFGERLGIQSEEWENHQPSIPMKEMVSLFKRHAADLDETVGIASLYAYESQIPEICVSKIEGLQRYYQIENPRYFQIHIEADQEHAAQERALIASSLTPDNFPKVKEAVEGTLSALWDFLSSLCHRYDVRCAV